MRRRKKRAICKGSKSQEFWYFTFGRFVSLYQIRPLARCPLTPPFSSADDEFPISKCVIRWTSWGLTAAIRKNNITVLTRAQFGISIESGAERVRTRNNTAERTFDRSAAEQHLLCFFSVRSGSWIACPQKRYNSCLLPPYDPPKIGRTHPAQNERSGSSSVTHMKWFSELLVPWERLLLIIYYSRGK